MHHYGTLFVFITKLTNSVAKRDDKFCNENDVNLETVILDIFYTSTMSAFHIISIKTLLKYKLSNNTK